MKLTLLDRYLTKYNLWRRKDIISTVLKSTEAQKGRRYDGNFWHNFRKSKKVILALAPLANVTDPSFRRIVAKYGKPDVLFTEFIPAIAIARNELRKKVSLELQYDSSERPIVAQIFGNDPDVMYDAVQHVRSLGFDGIDINMGCPDRAVLKQGCGGGLIKNPVLAQKLIRAAQMAAEDSGPNGENPRPFGISVKTRIGNTREIIDDWLPYLLEMEPDALTLHLRTVKEMSEVPAHWNEEVVGKAVRWIRYGFNSNTLIIGNGDIKNKEQALYMANKFDLNGIMIGRGIFGNPYLFSSINPTPQQRLEVLLEHNRLFMEIMCPERSPSHMKRHYKAYVTGFENSKEVRLALYNTNSIQEFESLVLETIQKLNNGDLKIVSNES